MIVVVVWVVGMASSDGGGTDSVLVVAIIEILISVLE